MLWFLLVQVAPTVFCCASVIRMSLAIRGERAAYKFAQASMAREREAMRLAIDAIEKERAAMVLERAAMEDMWAASERAHASFMRIPAALRERAPQDETRAAWLFVAEELERAAAQASAPKPMNARGGSA